MELAQLEDENDCRGKNRRNPFMKKRSASLQDEIDTTSYARRSRGSTEDANDGDDDDDVIEVVKTSLKNELSENLATATSSAETAATAAQERQYPPRYTALDRTLATIAAMSPPSTTPLSEEAVDDARSSPPPSRPSPPGAAVAAGAGAAALCADPIHYHSFRKDRIARVLMGPSALLMMVPKCCACQKRLVRSIFDSSEEIVRCIACGMYAHRNCAFSSRHQINNLHTIPHDDHVNHGYATSEQFAIQKCPVNGPILAARGDLPNWEPPDGDIVLLEESQTQETNPHPTTTHTNLDDDDMVLMSRTEAIQNSDPDPDLLSTMVAVGGPAGEDSVHSTDILTVEQESPAFLRRDGSNSFVHMITHAVKYGFRASCQNPDATDNIDNLDITERMDDNTNVFDATSDYQSSLADTDAVEYFDDELSDISRAVWKPNGPPQHWALNSPTALNGLRVNSQNDSEKEQQQHTDDSDDKTDKQTNETVNNSFLSVSKLLQENLIYTFLRRPSVSDQQNHDTDTDDTQSDDMLLHNQLDDDAAEAITRAVSGPTDPEDQQDDDDEDVANLLTEIEPPPDKPKSDQSKNETGPAKTYKNVSSVIGVAQKTSKIRSSAAVASVAGGIAGGVAGLAMAGPAGAIVGSKLGQVAGVLGVVLEGGMSVGVIVAGVAAGTFTAKQVRENNRVLNIGGNTKGNSGRPVVLVRPNVVVAPEWAELAADARRTAPSRRRGFGIIANHQAKVAEMAKKDRLSRDADVVDSNECEIATEDKIVLLVSRSLSDKMSLPGHVYRFLVNEHKNRAEKNPLVVGKKETSQQQDDPLDAEPWDSPRRARRQNAHGVIKHVTETLLEVRPGFGSSSRRTEMSATAVEGLVFGEIYDSVFEEIAEETKEKDDELIQKIDQFLLRMATNYNHYDNVQSLDASDHTTDDMTIVTDGTMHSVEEIEDENMVEVFGGVVSPQALEILRALPESRSAVEKLKSCVRFLELISVLFTTASASSGRKKRLKKKGVVMDADYLLKSVCQHIVVAKVPHLNAEIAFVEEFARDEHLLRGKEGYALVTLQASLHFLNASTDFDQDIFHVS